MYQFAGEAVADIHHRRGADSGFVELFDYVAPCFGFQLAFHQVFFTAEVRLEIALSCRCGLFAFEQLETHICGAKVAGDAYKIGVAGTIATDGLALRHFADAGNGNHQSLVRGTGVAADNVHSIFLAGEADSAVERFDVLHSETPRDAQADSDLPGSAAHGVDI